jgi:hypothetical protein
MPFGLARPCDLPRPPPRLAAHPAQCIGARFGQGCGPGGRRAGPIRNTRCRSGESAPCSGRDYAPPLNRDQASSSQRPQNAPVNVIHGSSAGADKVRQEVKMVFFQG